MRQSLILLAAAAAFATSGAASLAASVAGAGAFVPAGVQGVSDAAIFADEAPRYLSEFGFFADQAARQPATRVVPYELNVPLWSDGADKRRFIYLPAGTRLTADGEGLLQFPVGAAIIKSFAFGEGADERLIETRVLLHRADGWTALPYRWNAEQTEARLAIAGGRLDVVTPAGEAISYRIPNKNQCKECHSLDGAVIPIGPKARNMARGWLAGMAEAGMLDHVPQGADSLPHWITRHDADAPAEPLARAYLDVNCGHCHQPGAKASNSGLDLRWEQEAAQAIGIFKRPVAAGRGAGGHNFAIVPGDPDASILAFRMASAEPGVAMPEQGKSSIDREGLAIIRRWIAEMPPRNPVQ
ncbi:MAG: SO2930 family diheme c-type cytochrome [Erythrobacter sp.]